MPAGLSRDGFPPYGLPDEYVYIVLIDKSKEGLCAVGSRKSRALEYFGRIGALEKPIAAVYTGETKLEALRESREFLERFDERTWRNAKAMDKQEVLQKIQA